MLKWRFGWLNGDEEKLNMNLIYGFKINYDIVTTHTYMYIHILYA